MPSFFDLQKYAATGIAAPDMTHFDKMRALAAFGGGKTQTMTGVPPLSFKSDGDPLVSWSMLGNSSQTGTPTPDAPIQPEFVGVRTANLFDGIYTAAIMSVAGNTATLYTASSGRTAIVKCDPNTTYTVKKYGVSNRFIIAESDIDPVSGTAMSIILNNSSKTEYSFTTSNTAQYVGIYCSTSSEQAEPPLMLNLGSTALPYEPFGWAEKITNAGQTVPVYLGQTQTVRRINKLALTGQESVSVTSTGMAVIALGISPVVGEECFCSHYIGTNNTSYSAIGAGECTTSIVATGGGNRLVINDVSLSTADAYKAFFAQQYAAGTPVTVWYVLAEPTTGIVNEPLCKIGDYADELSSTDAAVTIPTVKGDNTLTVETDLQPSEMTIKYRE